MEMHDFDNTWEEMTQPTDYLRWGLMAGGAVLALFGLMRRSVIGMGLAALGGGLVIDAMTGQQTVNRLREWTERRQGEDGDATIPYGHGIRVEESIVINRPRAEVYRFWRNLANLPLFMQHLQSILVVDDKFSRWTVQAPAGMTVQWNAEIINDVENEMIAWRSMADADVDNAGSVHFEDTPDGGTLVWVNLKYDPPAGKLGAAFAKIFGEEPSKQIRDDLNNLKQILEGTRTPTNIM